jgi:hypothetical protein
LLLNILRLADYVPTLLRPGKVPGDANEALDAASIESGGDCMKNSVKAFAAVSCLGVAALVAPQLAEADQWNKKTILTVNETIQVPGAVLQPGKYVMKLADSPSNRHIVHVYNEREDQLMTTILAVPNYRLQPTGQTEFQWWEVPAGQPRALRAWFYPGDNFGQEFAYPKTAAVQIAAANNANVPTTYAENQAELSTARVGTVDRVGTERELDQETYTRENEQASSQTAEQPAAAPQTERTAEQQVAQNQPAPQAESQADMNQQTPAAAASDDMNRRSPVADSNRDMDTGADAGVGTRARTERLPDTASPFPFVGMLGLAAFGAAGVIRAAKRS